MIFQFLFKYYLRFVNRLNEIYQVHFRGNFLLHEQTGFPLVLSQWFSDTYHLDIKPG